MDSYPQSVEPVLDHQTELHIIESTKVVIRYFYADSLHGSNSLASFYDSYIEPWSWNKHRKNHHTHYDDNNFNLIFN